MNCNIYLMRHAPSQHNILKEQYKKTHSNHSDYKETQEYLTLKYSPTLVDSRIVENTCIYQARKTLELTNIRLILCSPMRRCLQTCSRLLEGHSKQLKVIVEPLLSSRLNSAWSVGPSIKQASKEFHQFDFSAFEGKQETWGLMFLEKTRKIEGKDILENAHRAQSFLLKTLTTKKGESYTEFRQRVSCLKTRMRALIEGNGVKPYEDERVLVISHACVLNFLTAREYTEKGKVKNKVGFEYCVPKVFQASQILAAGHMDHLESMF